MWHVLALALGGRSIAEWKASMSAPEFRRWVEFYNLSPFDDLHRYHRPAALVAASMGGAEIADQIRWLRNGPEPAAAINDGDEKYSDADRATLQAFGLLKKG